MNRRMIIPDEQSINLTHYIYKILTGYTLLRFCHIVFILGMTINPEPLVFEQVFCLVQ